MRTVSWRSDVSSRRHLGLIALALLTIAVAGVLAIAALPRAASAGPLASSVRIREGVPLAIGSALTWGMVLPSNTTDSEITIETLEPATTRGIRILDVLVHHPGGEGGIGQQLGFPPPGVDAVRPAGVVMTPAGTPGRHIEVLIGIERIDASRGVLQGLRVQYRHRGTLYEDVLDYALEVFPPPA
jgi:hypothetical protein